MVRRALVTVLWAIAMLAPSAVAQAKRAFIVGVGAYEELTDLRKTVGDANGYEKLFDDTLGFQVTRLTGSQKRRDFVAAFDAFVRSIGPRDEVAFIFSGHGWSDGSDNYLSLADTPRGVSEAVLQNETIPLQRMVMARLRSRNPKLILAIIDACRDEQYGSLTKSAGALDKGIVRISANEGELILYSSGAGQTSLDRLSDADPSPYSVFTRALLPKLANPNRPLATIADEARSEVQTLAGSISHPQRPEMMIGISLNYCLSGSCVAPAAPGRQLAPLDADTALWVEITSSRRSGAPCDDYRRYLEAFPDGINSGRARGLLSIPPCAAPAPEAPDRARDPGSGREAAADTAAVATTVESSRQRGVTGAREIRTLAATDCFDNPGPAGNGIDCWLISIAYSPDGRLIATGHADYKVRLWDASDGRLHATLQGHSGRVRSVSFSPDGRVLASGSEDQTVRLWDAATSQLSSTLVGHGSLVSSVSFSPDGRALASGSWDNTVRLWDASTGQHSATLRGHRRNVKSVAFSPDGRALASGSDDGTIRLWDVSESASRATLEDNQQSLVHSVAFSSDGRTLASGSNFHTVQLWDVSTGQPRATLTGHKRDVLSVAFSPDGRTIASGSEYGIVRLWDVATGELRATLDGHVSPVNAVAFSPDGLTLASASDDGTAKLWALEFAE